MADQAEERIEAALEALEGVAGPSAAAERARANRLLLQVEALEHQKDADDRSGSGSGSDPARTAPAPGAATTAPAAVAATTTRRATTVPAGRRRLRVRLGQRLLRVGVGIVGVQPVGVRR